MVHSVATILTTTAMLLHALLGCCYHHAHKGETRTSHFQDEQSKHGTEVSSVCSHSHAATCNTHGRSHADTTTGDSTPGNPDGHDHNQLPCHEGHCTYVNTVPVELTTLMLTASFDVLTVVRSLNSTVAAKWFECNPVSADSSTSAGVRLRTQVWLL